MNKSNSIKLLIAILFIFILLSLHLKSEVRATEIEMDNLPEPMPLKIVTREDLDRAEKRQHINSESIIIKYDRETGESLEINMGDLKQSSVEANIFENFVGNVIKFLEAIQMSLYKSIN